MLVKSGATSAFDLRFQGSVRRAYQRVRLTVELVDTAGGNHLWGERYDRELQEIFTVQDELTRAIVATLPGQIEEAGRQLAKRKPTSNMTAYDLVLLGNDRWRRLTRSDLAEALNFFRRAVAIDPHYARAHANIAWTHVCSIFIEVTDETSIGEALRHIETSLDIDDSDAWSHGVYAQLLFLLRRDDEAEIHFNRALALNPNDADVVAVFANILVYWGRWREALTWMDTAKRLNPLPPNLYHWYHALALYSAREYEQAIKVLKQMRSSDRWSHCLLAACYAQTDQLDKARSELEVFVSEREHELKDRGETPRAPSGTRVIKGGQIQEPSGPRTFPRWFAEGRHKRLITRLVARQTSRCGDGVGGLPHQPRLLMALCDIPLRGRIWSLSGALQT